jgi:hypothetical protein
VSRLSITTTGRKLAFRPGEACEGEVSWQLDETPELVELRLFWYSEAKGEQDVEVAASQAFEATPQGEGHFRFEIPAGPLSFTGPHVTLSWALELVAEPGEETERLDVLVSTIGREIRLEEIPPLDEEQMKKLPGFLQKLMQKKQREQARAAETGDLDE